MSGVYRPETYSEIIGHKDLIRLTKDRIMARTYAQGNLYFGEEGTGKTTLMKVNAKAINCTSEIMKPCGVCPSCIAITENVIRNNVNTDNVYSFKMSVNGGKEAAQEVIACMNTSMSSTPTKVLILDELHGMDYAAQDALLQDMEYIPKGVFIQAGTTDITKLRKAFLSRLVKWPVGRLTPPETIHLLTLEVARRRLVLKNEQVMLQLIASLNDYKPRACLMVLEQCGSDTEVTMKDLQTMLAFTSVSKIVPIISSLNGSVVVGMNAILDLVIEVNTQSSILEILTEAFKMTQGQKTSRLGHEDTELLREAVRDLNPSVLGNLLYSVASTPLLTKQFLLASYLKVHPSLQDMSRHDDQVLSAENNLKINVLNQGLVEDNNQLGVTSIDELLANSEVYE